MQEAMFYERQERQSVRCLLCPHHCRMEQGAHGICRVRVNRQGRLYSGNWGLITGLSSDPVEKKPLYHFFPAREILSLGTFGCNFKCVYCQNHTISQSSDSSYEGLVRTLPEQIVADAKRAPSSIGLAFSYNEPTVWYEYMYDIAYQAAAEGLRNVVVSNGYINPRPLQQLMEVVHAFNIDLKSFSNHFYKDIAGGSLIPVKRTLKAIRKRGVHLEITHLVVTGLNDDEREFGAMVGWIANELGRDTVLHISRYFPAWKLDHPPTNVKLLSEFYSIAREKLYYVYLGNVLPGTAGSDTACARCGSSVIERTGCGTSLRGLDRSGKCAQCGKKVAVM